MLGAAVLLGIALLRQYDTGSGAPQLSQPVESNDSVTTTTRRQGSVSIVPTPTTRALRSASDIKVLAANATNTSGLGARTTTALQNQGYNALSPVDATRTVEATQVQYQPDYEAEARALAQFLQLPASSVRPMEDSPPVPETRDANIIVIAGPDLTLSTSTTSTTRRL